ncbi:hypothetical protein [Eubacterium ventriosum]|uniref:hypothetical protein n=1 Tax=Eubacterium ventriosum TaxID=39496 RepID=UPI00265F1199|nr:hypothetical protein [Eubacterium ventriosum]
MKKYELTEDTRIHNGRKLHRIKALRDFGDVKKGDLGGWIESESNLSQNDKCWVYDNAEVSGAAAVEQNAQIRNIAFVSNSAKIRENAIIKDRTIICQRVSVSGEAVVEGGAILFGDVEIWGEAVIGGDVTIDEYVQIGDNAKISKETDYATVKGFGRQCRSTIFHRCKDGIVRVRCGCFYGTIEEFRKAVCKTHKNHKKMKQDYLKIAELMELHFEEEQDNDK